MEPMMCYCGSYPVVEPAAKTDGKKYVCRCARCDLRARGEYDNAEDAVEAWNKKKFTVGSVLIQRKLTAENMDDNGFGNLVVAIYELAKKDYAAYNLDQYIGTPANKIPENVSDIEKLFRQGYYLHFYPGEIGVDQLKKSVEEMKNSDKVRTNRKRRDLA